MKAKFITFEGCEGAGKTTQINNLYNYLTEKGIKAIKTREPGGTESAEKIREILIDKNLKLDKYSELLLHITARNEHIKNVIKPALANNIWVLCDRFTDSTVAYQGYGHGLGADIVYDICQKIFDNFGPDLTFFINISPQISMQRAKNRSNDILEKEKFADNRYEQMNIDFHEKVYNGFLEIMANNRDRFIDINGNQDIELVTEDILLIMNKTLT